MAPAKRPLADIIAQLRLAIANDSISTALIQTQDLQTLVDAAAKQLGRT